MADTIEKLNGIDRDALMERLASELPWVSGEMGDSIRGIAIRTGLDRERLSLIVSGKRKMKWSEYLSILFVLWDRLLQTRLYQHLHTLKMNILRISLIKNVLQRFVRILCNTRLILIFVRNAVFVQNSVLLELLPA